MSSRILTQKLFVYIQTLNQVGSSDKVQPDLTQCKIESCYQNGFNLSIYKLENDSTVHRQ